MSKEAQQSIAQAAQAAADALELDPTLSAEEQKRERKRAYTKEYNRLYRESHKDELKQRMRKYRETHREQALESTRKCNRKTGRVKSALGFEVLSTDDLEALSHAPTDMSLRVIDAMNVDFAADYKQQFEQLLLGQELTTELLDQAFKLARSSSVVNSKRGHLFEDVVRKNILYELRMHSLKLYSQVPINGGSCKVDFVISAQVCEDKRDLDLSQSVVLSTKTRLSTHWREDMHLYDRCKAYFMLTLDDKAPTENVPPNVYFVSPHYTTSDVCNVLNLNDLLSVVMKYLDISTDADTEAATSAEDETSSDP